MSTIHELYSFQTKGYSEMNEMISMCAFKLVWNDKKNIYETLICKIYTSIWVKFKVTKIKTQIKKQRCKCINMSVTIVTKNLNLYSLMLHKNLLKNNPGFLSYQKSS